MSTTLTNISRQQVVSNLDSYVYTVPTLDTYQNSAAGVYVAKIYVPVIPPSGLTVTIAQTGSASVSVSTSAPAASQSVINLAKVFNLAVGDVVTFTLASSTPSDETINSFEGTLLLTRGSVV